MNGSISSSDSEETSFVQTEQERILKNSNIFKQKEQSNNTCTKHPNKKAKYYVQCDKSKQFCSKCALNLALKGLKIEEKQENQHEIKRQQRINSFQELLQQIMEQCTNKFLEFNNIEVLSGKQLLEHQDSCQQFFDSVTNIQINKLQFIIFNNQQNKCLYLNRILSKIYLIYKNGLLLTLFRLQINQNKLIYRSSKMIIISQKTLFKQKSIKLNKQMHNQSNFRLILKKIMKIQLRKWK